MSSRPGVPWRPFPVSPCPSPTAATALQNDFPVVILFCRFYLSLILRKWSHAVCCLVSGLYRFAPCSRDSPVLLCAPLVCLHCRAALHCATVPVCLSIFLGFQLYRKITHIHFPVDGHLSSFKFGAVNILEQISL